MWDAGRPLKMLNTLRYDSFLLQCIIDVDKYIASSKEGYDLCRNYIQYCSFCNKWVKNPCASAYLVGSHFNSVCRLLNQCCVTELPVIQAITDIDKYLISKTVDFDVCGMYAPFCKLCVKSVPNPCATAYLKYITGHNREPANRSQTVTDATEACAVTTYEIDGFADNVVYGSEKVVEEVVYKSELPAHSDCVTKPNRRLIKIATVRRRTIISNKNGGRIN